MEFVLYCCTLRYNVAASVEMSFNVVIPCFPVNGYLDMYMHGLSNNLVALGLHDMDFN